MLKKKTVFTFLMIFNGLSLLSQTTSYDCNTDFWTITHDGYIQQWSLLGGNITGGDTVLQGGGTSLAYSNFNGSPAFFSGTSVYDNSSGWTEIPQINSGLHASGGFENDLYFRVPAAFHEMIVHWDGSSFVTIDTLLYSGVFDIATDTLGQAWVFTGIHPSIPNSLRVYDKNGMISFYSFSFNKIAMGSFFLNDKLFIGTQDSIFPVLIGSATAQLGDPIPFPNVSFMDMASCPNTEFTTSVLENSKTKFKLFPNPTSGYLTLPLDIERSNISVYDSKGRLIEPKFNGQILDLTEQPSGVYFIKIKSDDLPNFHKVMKM